LERLDKFLQEFLPPHEKPATAPGA